MVGMKLISGLTCALSILAAAAGSVATAVDLDIATLPLAEGTCESNCNLLVDYGSTRFWYYVDGAGERHLDYREETGGRKAFGDAPRSVTYFHAMPVVGSKAGEDRCGKDGWGWQDGEQINGINYGMFSLYTNYSHAGNAVRVTVDNETGAIIGNPVSVTSGIRGGTPLKCKDKRDAVQEK
jgi:hypothetical protein